MEAIDAGMVVKWTLVAVALAPMVLGIGWAVLEGSILPQFIPRAEIERLADVLMARYPHDPEGAAFAEEQTAWFRSEGYEQGKWHRVHRRLESPHARPSLAVAAKSYPQHETISFQVGSRAGMTES